MSIEALQGSEFANLGDKLLLSIMIRVRRDSHRAIAATCRKFQLLVCGRLFIAARIQCPTTGLPCEFAPCRQTGSVLANVSSFIVLAAYTGTVWCVGAVLEPITILAAGTLAFRTLRHSPMVQSEQFWFALRIPNVTIVTYHAPA